MLIPVKIYDHIAGLLTGNGYLYYSSSNGDNIKAVCATESKGESVSPSLSLSLVSVGVGGCFVRVLTEQLCLNRPQSSSATSKSGPDFTRANVLNKAEFFGGECKYSFC